jgi:hypothetical protein
MSIGQDFKSPPQHEEDPTLREGLECLIGRARVAVPIDAVAQIIEYEVAPPPPLARRWVGGLGTYAEKVVLSVALVAPRPGATQPLKRTAKGVLLQSGDSELAWVLEITQVAARVKAKVVAKSVQVGQDKLPPWINSASTEDKRSIGWIDVPAMLKELSGTTDPTTA